MKCGQEADFLALHTPVRAEKAEDLALANRERDAAHRLDLTGPPHQIGSHDHRRPFRAVGGSTRRCELAQCRQDSVLAAGTAVEATTAMSER